MPSSCHSRPEWFRQCQARAASRSTPYPTRQLQDRPTVNPDQSRTDSVRGEVALRDPAADRLDIDVEVLGCLLDGRLGRYSAPVWLSMPPIKTAYPWHFVTAKTPKLCICYGFERASFDIASAIAASLPSATC
jgi:hypothetical protein